MKRTNARQLPERGFSLIELVIVVVIVAVIAAIAIPRLSRGTVAATDAAMSQNLATLRGALEHYQIEHNGSYPTLLNSNDALTKYSDAAGTGTSAVATSKYNLGPYLRSIPELPAGDSKGGTVISLDLGFRIPLDSVGWLYNQTNGTIRPNCQNETDSLGRKYASY